MDPPKTQGYDYYGNVKPKKAKMKWYAPKVNSKREKKQPTNSNSISRQKPSKRNKKGIKKECHFPFITRENGLHFKLQERSHGYGLFGIVHENFSTLLFLVKKAKGEGYKLCFSLRISQESEQFSKTNNRASCRIVMVKHGSRSNENKNFVNEKNCPLLGRGSIVYVSSNYCNVSVVGGP